MPESPETDLKQTKKCNKLQTRHRRNRKSEEKCWYDESPECNRVESDTVEEKLGETEKRITNSKAFLIGTLEEDNETDNIWRD